VAFSPVPVIDKLAPEVPFYIPAETRKMRVTPHGDAEIFWNRLGTEVAGTSSGSVVVFVHGYSYGFERNCRAAAELQRALLGKAVVLMFSWPSDGNPLDYLADQADIEWSVPFLARVLAQLGDLVGHRSVQVVAHSLGTRGVVFALDRLSAASRLRPVIGPLVLVAPDFDAQTFVDRLPGLVPLTGGITLYASSNDTPLKVSQQLHQYPRLGVAGEFLTVAEGMQTVDVSPVGRYQVLGHEYFLFHPQVVADLAMLLGDALGAAERPGLRALHRDGLTHWELTEEIAPEPVDGG
jgi:esterase/lipase superfamily enzyme